MTDDAKKTTTRKPCACTLRTAPHRLRVMDNATSIWQCERCGHWKCPPRYQVKTVVYRERVV